MATAPFQLWMDCVQIATAVRTSSTVTVTTVSDHGLVSGDYVWMENAAGAIGTTMNGVYQITVTSGSAFTYTSAGSAGTGIAGGTALTTEVFARDLLNPLLNYGAAARGSALYADIGSIQMSASGDGQGASFGFTALQDDTPGSAPWYLTIPDQPRIRLVKKDTGSTPTVADYFFVGMAMSFEAQLSASGQGSEVSVSCVDANAVLDRAIIYGG